MSEFITTLASISGLLVGLACGVVWLWIVPRSRGARWWLTGLLIVYFAASMHGVARVISWPLRRGFQPLTLSDAPPSPRAIVVLGAGARTVHGRAQKIGILTPGGSSRVLEAARVFRVYGGPWVISSGGPPPGSDMIPESETMKRALVELGVAPDRILLESTSRVTHDEAVLTARMLRDLGIRSCIVVTSDLHMPRALAAFRHAGLEATPSVARDPLDSQWKWLSWLPTRQGLEYSQEVIHEYVGLAWYWSRGWM